MTLVDKIIVFFEGSYFLIGLLLTLAGFVTGLVALGIGMARGAKWLSRPDEAATYTRSRLIFIVSVAGIVSIWTGYWIGEWKTGRNALSPWQQSIEDRSVQRAADARNKEFVDSLGAWSSGEQLEEYLDAKYRYVGVRGTPYVLDRETGKRLDP